MENKESAKTQKAAAPKESAEAKKSGGRTGIQFKLIAALAVLMAILCAAITLISARLYRNKMESIYSSFAFSQARIAADMIDGDRIEQYYTTGETDEYYELVQTQLELNKKENNLEYFYVVIPRENDMVYIWDAGSEGEEGVCGLLDTDPYYEGGEENMMKAFAKGAEDVLLITDSEDYGYLASAYVAVLDSSGEPVALAAVDISMEMINEQINRFIANSFILTFIIFVIASVIYYFYIKKIIVTPVKTLASAVEEYVNNKEKGKKKRAFALEPPSNDEIGELYSSVDQMEIDIDNYIKDLRAVTAEKERIGAELNIAARIQADMLPSIFPPFPDRKEFDIYATMDPAKEVGGDFYDFFLVDDDHLAMVIADVSGKGVPAALFMVIAKTLMKDQSFFTISPKAIFETVNNRLCENNASQMFVTAWMGVMEISTGIVKAASAGHEYPALRKANGEFEILIDKHGLALAAMEDVKYTEYEFTIEQGGTLYVYTDGVAEATNKKNELFGTERMINALNKDPSADPQTLLSNVRASIDKFVGEREQFDDITMLAIKLKEKSANDNA